MHTALNVLASQVTVALISSVLLSSAGGVVAHMHQVSAIGLYRCLCIPRMSARKGLSYGRLPDRSVCNYLT